MNNEQSSDRLNRIENALDRITAGLEETKAVINSNSRAIQAMSEQQAAYQTTYQLKHQETMAIVESNSRAIQAMMEQQVTDRLAHEEAMAEMRELMKKMAETQSGLTKILIHHDEDRPTILRRLMAIENKVDRILEQNQE